MENNISEQSKTENETTEIVIEESAKIVSDSVFKKFFLEVASITTFTFRFFKEVIKPPYEFNEVMKQSFLKNVPNWLN